MVSHSSHDCAACCAFVCQGLSVQGADKGDLHKFNMQKRALVARNTMCFDSEDMTESLADQELTVDGGAGDVLPKHDVGDGATNQDDDEADDAPAKRPKCDASRDDDSFSVCDILGGVPEVLTISMGT